MISTYKETPMPEFTQNKKAASEMQHLFMERIKAYMCPPPEVSQLESNILNGIILDGGMGSGKTTIGTYLIKWAINKVISEYGTDERDVAYIHSNSMPINEVVSAAKESIDFRGKKYLYIFNDDAIAGKGQHSRQSQTKENVAMAQFYVNMRHQFEDCGMPKSCAIIPIHSTQVYSHLDRVFRCTCYMTIFKDWPNETTEQQEITYQIGKQAADMLRRITQIRKFSMDPEKRIRALSSFVVKTVDPEFPVIYVRPHESESLMKYKEIECPVEPLVIEPESSSGAESEQDSKPKQKVLGTNLNQARQELMTYNFNTVKYNKNGIVSVDPQLEVMIRKLAIQCNTGKSKMANMLMAKGLELFGYDISCFVLKKEWPPSRYKKRNQ